jgi:4-diphosphocytidyl-2C-methyl-D-erythritol kinase
MRILAPAKVNLHLRVAPPEGSGFHPLLSWFCAVGLFDTLTIRETEDGTIALTSDDPSLPCDATNLVMRAATALRSAVPRQTSGVSIHLQKRIAAGGGLGGGSSDAAWTLLALNRLWKLDLPIDQLSGIAATLGSDVPFFLHGPSSFCTGRGEIVQPIPKPRPGWIVLILPVGIALPTQLVYRKFDELRLGDRSLIDAQPPWLQWAELSAGPLLAGLVNDLEPAAFALCPELGTLRDRLEQVLSRIVRMSGSGSSLFTLFDEQSEAQAAVERIEGENESARARTVPLAPDLSAP